MKKALLIFLILGFLFFFNYLPTLAQDPGIPDIVRFLLWGTYVPCSPCTGRAVVPMYVFNDESIEWMFIPLEWTGEISLDTILFAEGRFDDPYYPGVFIINEEKKVFITNLIPEYMPPGQGIYLYMYFTVQDTGLATIDLTIPITDEPFNFTDSTFNVFPPHFIPSEFRIQEQNILPGDVNQDGHVFVSDVIYLVNYLFKGGSPPAYLPSGDVNLDCKITVSDVVYIINYLFKNGSSLEMGCCFTY